jgi:ubiquinone/menaquinone biosynthesis C-methylase UbiE
LSEAEFDRIADVYDETRRALDEKTLGGLMEMLTKYGCRSILEIAVGTGRVSVPLMRRGYEITGADISRRMMEKARAKGLANLVLADGSGTAFRDGSFDAVLMAHIFHLLENPLAVMREGARVSRIGVFALLRKGNRPWFGFWGSGVPPVAPAVATTGKVNDQGINDQATAKLFEERRERFRKIAEKYHWTWDSARRVHNWGRETEILESHPPDELKVVSDVVVTETLEDRIARFQKGGYGFMSEMPAEMREEVIKQMRADAASLPEWARQPGHEVYQVAMWRSEKLLVKRSARPK